ncbi:binding [Zea mays]|uniref:Binding n=1 Tax=Zea mays TaxID=4577 RepID=A0A1D6LXE1_MAIZE|nr:binding [Zea mays]
MKEKDRDDSTDTELLVSPSTRTPVSKQNKGAKKSNINILSSVPKKSADADSTKRTVEPRSLNGSLKRQKSKPISGLLKVMINSVLYYKPIVLATTFVQIMPIIGRKHIIQICASIFSSIVLWLLRMCLCGQCSTQDSSSTDLVGHRIKVWWPLDKRYVV